MTGTRALVLIFVLGVAAAAQQMADPNFQTAVDRPAHTKSRPRVVVDEAHENFHTADGRYKPFADLLRADGCEVVAGKEKLTKAGLAGARVLVIANAAAPDATDDTSGPAFAEEECDAVREWVRGGGSLLLVADHTPFGAAAASLGARFGVDMGKGFVFDAANAAEGSPTLLVFSRENRLLGDHPILRGRDPSEEVKRVIAFTGQSLSVPAGATPLFLLGATAREAATRADLENGAAAREAGGRAQAVAMKFGKGRVVVLGEAAMLSAQVVRFEEDGKPQEFKMGMNVPGSDDRQFALNLVRWLTGSLN